MTRIVAGRFKGHRLATPKSRNTRPTTERVREALFSRLEHYDALAGANVLDLYAGSGALAFEAVSRGARGAVLVEIAKAAADAARTNAAALGLNDQVEVVAQSVASWRPDSGDEPFDLVFADPPYDVEERAVGAFLERLAEPGVLTEEAVIMVERSVRSPEPAWPAGLERLDERRYGETVLWFAQPELPKEDQDQGQDVSRETGPA